MVDPRNVVIITGGIVVDPEVINDNIVKFRIGVDYAGSEKGSDNNSGYFDIVYYTKDGGRNAEFVRDQITSGKMKKASQIQLVGRLVHERWGSDEKRGQKVVVVAESINYSGSNRSESSTQSSGEATSTASAVPQNF